MTKKIFLGLFILFNVIGTQIDLYSQDSVVLQHGAHHIGRRQDPEMKRWRGYGLGEFIHFGLYSILGGVYKGELYNGVSPFIRVWNKMPNSAYDSLTEQFNPKSFNADQWAKMAKQMGAKYVTITTRHHDGFCLWPSKFSDFTIAQTPYKKDMVGALVKAYDKQGIDVYLYYSVLDWHSKDWRYDLTSAADSLAFDRFKLFVKNQLTELLTQYPSVKGLWFDGTWDKSWQKSGAFSDSLEQYLKQLRPGLVIGSRLRADEFGNRHYDANGHLMGDYEQGWERRIPADYKATKGLDWEAVMTSDENGWGYREKWMGHWKTANELLEMLAKCVSLDGNFVLNFGPKGDGSFPQKEVEEAKAIGNWMDVNSAAIYNTGYTGWQKEDWGYSTLSEDKKKAYLIVFNAPVSGSVKLLPNPKQKIVNAYFITEPKKRLAIEPIDYGVNIIHIPKKIYKSPFVIVLDLVNQEQQTGKTEKART